MRFALLLRELQKIQRPTNVYLVGSQRRELRARGQQRRKVKYAIHLELGEHSVKQVRIGNRSEELAADERRQLRIERIDVKGDDAGLALRELADERVADLATGARDQDDRFSHCQIVVRGIRL